MKLLATLLLSLFLVGCGAAAARTATLTIEGMTCENCVAAITQSLSTVAGVEEIVIDLEAGSAVVTYQPRNIRAEQIAERISRMQFPARVQ
ncbi:MAG: heavy metal-associated domain-containing protein [Limnospira sp. PMC 1291.21]|uniref:heavy-metal-associated domain-containing protein n=1 Tax=Limnospira sp. PMC 1291.21 TaxID=2981074 RepID=UPI0028E0E6AE|nr:heavy metal-associated domain-containing protein [Limnospira sp. PMC 1291.21]MDT9307882.1 heavy metal-associated domain-containing protein [Limnospira sp. PMC 1291.21]